MSLFLYHLIVTNPAWGLSEKLFVLLFFRANLNDCYAAEIFLRMYDAAFPESWGLASFWKRVLR